MNRERGKFSVMPDMINVGYWSVYENQCYNNRRFMVPDFGRQKDVAGKYNELYKSGQDRKVNFLSLDLVDDYGKLDCFLFSDFPRLKNRLVKKAFASQKPMFLILEESEVVYPKNWDVDNHKFFDKIFTWHDGFVDNKKYFRFNIRPVDIRTTKKDFSKKEKLCTLIASNKSYVHPLELFSERRKALMWFEKNHPEDFDLYGYDWDLSSFPLDKKGWSKLGSDKLKFLRKFLARKHPSWKGEIDYKISILEKYRFAICYENAKDLPGYISEKIFDAFIAGTIPIYWGASNITDYIPPECFIDKRNFDDYEVLYWFMKDMDNKQYLGYLDNIEDFLKSDKMQQFSTECFCNTIIDEITKTVTDKTDGDTRF